MRLSDLERLGIPRRIVEVWRERQGESLLPVQRQALRQGLLDITARRASVSDGVSGMIVSAPTSSGKSFCAEMAAVSALTARRKAVLLFPMKSLAEQNYRLLRDTYEPLGIRCLIATGDHPENDQRFAAGDYHLAVAIYEKFDLLLTADLDALSNIGLVVVDELEMLTEPGRGAVLERLLTKILASCYQPAILALSAVLDDDTAAVLARWLSASVVKENSRPVDLLRGVAAEGSVRFRSFNGAQDGSEPFAIGDAAGDLADVLIGQLRQAAGPTLVFLKSRQDTVQLALRLAASVQWPEANGATARLREEEPSFLVRSLIQTLTRGIAFHNSDLTPWHRSVVEESFINGEVRVLCSTTTLALGVNLPAETVYLETVRYAPGNYDRRPVLVPITRAEFDNMTGRAGRYNFCRGVTGKAIVLADSEFERDVLWEQYISPDRPEAVLLPVQPISLDDWLLQMICAGVSPSLSAARSVLAKSLHTVCHPGAELNPEPAVEMLTRERLVGVGNGGLLYPTPAGRAVATAGLTVRQAVHLRGWLEQGYPQTNFGWTALAVSAPDWRLPPSILTRYEQAENLPLKLLSQRYDHSMGEITCLLPQDWRSQPLGYRTMAGLKALLVLDDWSRMVPVQSLEEQYQMHLGQIMSLGEAAAHLVSATAALVEAGDRQSKVVGMLRAHAFSLQHGLSADLRGLHACLGAVLNRSDFVALHEAGVVEMRQLGDLDSQRRAKFIRGEAKLRRINDIIDSFKEEVAMLSKQVGNRVVPAAEPDSVEIDGAFDRERFLVRINGFPVWLTGKSFKYFTRLAWSRLTADGGWIYKEDIEIGFNQARYLYRMKNEIAGGFSFPWQVVENNRLGYYRLQIDPVKIRVNQGRLRNHPDWEVRRLFAEPGTVAVG
ncbi:MAG TPA: DEAD/DEAH box helicase [Acidobacteriota bacterium]|nr:DEAD/DEAH box helicase [Acidobacteriota bacterium]